MLCKGNLILLASLELVTNQYMNTFVYAVELHRRHSKVLPATMALHGIFSGQPLLSTFAHFA